jgi:hypothetical protein
MDSRRWNWNYTNKNPVHAYEKRSSFDETPKEGIPSTAGLEHCWLVVVHDDVLIRCIAEIDVRAYQKG